MLKLLGEFYALQPRVGYYLLYFLNASNRHINRDSKAKANVYRDLCEEIDSKFSLDICLVNDMRQCQEDDVSLFVYLIPDIYRSVCCHFTKKNVELIQLTEILLFSGISPNMQWGTWTSSTLWCLVLTAGKSSSWSATWSPKTSTCSKKTRCRWPYKPASIGRHLSSTLSGR